MSDHTVAARAPPADGTLSSFHAVAARAPPAEGMLLLVGDRVTDLVGDLHQRFPGRVPLLSWLSLAKNLPLFIRNLERLSKDLSKWLVNFFSCMLSCRRIKKQKQLGNKWPPTSSDPTWESQVLKWPPAARRQTCQVAERQMAESNEHHQLAIED